MRSITRVIWTPVPKRTCRARVALHIWRPISTLGMPYAPRRKGVHRGTSGDAGRSGRVAVARLLVR
jgi:hypothetical protein